MVDETRYFGEIRNDVRGEGPGSRIGPYVLVRLLGEGGFGDVYEAQQEQPVRRKVALKVLKLGMDTREIIARFELERQALAMMEHPHIARVLDAGATDSGRPYFVMELVDGVPVSQFCEEHQLGIPARLLLFGQVCDAVQHAHTKGVIHRDLKPGNVLVGMQDGRPFARVIDFGIAKAAKGRLTDSTLATRGDQVIGTPLYMSPEQAMGSADIDTRTDIYSLGVILYELLTGSTPVERGALSSISMADTQRLICQFEPPRPSARILKLATTLGASHVVRDPHRLARAVRGELDWIAMKALEKDRSRRYETAGAFGEDIARYLAGAPVLAAPPGAAYLVGKFVRRHKGAVAAAALVVASLCAGVVAFAWQARIARAAERIAEQRAAELREVSQFQAAMLGGVDPTRIGKSLSDDVLDNHAAAIGKKKLSPAEHARMVAAFGEQWREVNATDVATGLIDRTILTPAVAELQKKFGKQPLVDASLRQALADSYAALGMLDKALALDEQALATRRRLLGDEDDDTLASMEKVGLLLNQQGKPEDAQALFRKTLDVRRRRHGENHPDTIASLADLGMALDNAGSFDQAEPFLRQSLAARRRLLGNDDKDTIDSISRLGGLMLDQGKPDLAYPLLRETLERSRRVLGEDDPQTLNAINDLGVVSMVRHRPQDAEAYFREAWEKHRRLQGEDHPNTLETLGNLGGVLMVEGKDAQAEPVLREAVERSRRVFGGDNGTTLLAMASLGKVLLDRGKFADAEALLAPSVDDARKTIATASPPQYGFFLLVLGKAQLAQREFAAAEATLLEAHGSFVKGAGEANGTYPVMCLQALVELYGAWDAAEPGKGHAAKADPWKAALTKLKEPLRPK